MDKGEKEENNLMPTYKHLSQSLPVYELHDTPGTPGTAVRRVNMLLILITGWREHVESGHNCQFGHQLDINKFTRQYVTVIYYKLYVDLLLPLSFQTNSM